MAASASASVSAPEHVLALDCGTTSVRAIVFDADGREAASARREFAQHFPRPGWVEHDATEIWEATLACAREAVAILRNAHGLGPGCIAAIGITNQRETVVVWDRATGRPIHRAIVWQDRRTSARLAELRTQGHEPSVRAATGLTLDPYFSASKLAWTLDAVAGARARAERGELAAGTIDSWIAWNLTAGRAHLTDASNASRTMLARIGGTAGATWDDSLCGLFDVPREVLPSIVDSSGIVATTDPALLGAGIPIAGIAGDQQAALFGQACRAVGDAKCTFGTGCFLLANAGDSAPVPPAGLLATVAWRIGGTTTYAVEGSVFVGGSAVQWLRDGLRIIAKSPDVNVLAAEVADSGGVVVVPAFAGLGAPWWDADARGAILGLSRGSSRAHVARATLEGVAHQVADLIEAVRAGGTAIVELRVDGGAAASDLLMQVQADLSGVPVGRPRDLETTALGAAELARRGVGGATPSLPPAFERRFDPSLDARTRDEVRRRWRRAVDTVRYFGSDA